MLDDNSFTANGAMDDIIYRNHLRSCDGYHHSTAPLSTICKHTETDHGMHTREHDGFPATSKGELNSQYFCLGCPANLECLDDCHDPTCDEPPCTECDEDVVVCTNSACSPPPDQGPCDAMIMGNTSCAGGVPQDVVHGAVVLRDLLQQSSTDLSFPPQHQFDFDPSATFFPDRSGHVHFYSQGPFYNTFGTSVGDRFDVATEIPGHRFCPSPDVGFSCNDGAGQCFNLTPDALAPLAMYQRISPQNSSIRSSYTSNSRICNSIPLRNSASVSTASSPFSPSTQQVYTFSQDSTSSVGTPFPESLKQNTVLQNYNTGMLLENNVDGHSEVRCLWVTKNEECGQTFENAGELQDHIQEIHTSTLKKSQGFVCQWFGCVRRTAQPDRAGFAQRSKLDRHIQSHTGYKACTCSWVEEDGSVCGKHFSTQQSLTLHQRTHTGERPHKCEHEGCDYAAAQASQLTMHIRTRHTKVKPLRCPYEGCGATFSESSNLSKHKKIHQPGEQCVCSLCERVFRRPDQLKRHMNTTHKSVAAKAQHRRSISLSGGVLESPLTASWQT